MFTGEKKLSILKIFLILLLALLSGVFLGYLGVRSKAPRYIEDNSYSDELPTESEEVIVLPKYETFSENIGATEEPSKDDTATETDCLIKLNNGKICLFERNENGVYSVKSELEININALKDEDKMLFKKGIVVKSKNELASVLEDFGS